MPYSPIVSRRSMFKGLAACGIPLAQAFATPGVIQRHYRADAVILLGSMPLMTKQGIGSGFATARFLEGAPKEFETLQFAAGSDPGRAGGLNRLGYVRETRQPGAAGTSYTGFMTASDEITIEQVTKSVENPGEKLKYKGIAGEVRQGVSRSHWLTFETPSDWNWNRFSELRAFAESMIRGAKPQGKENTDRSKTAAAHSFLSAMMRTIVDPGLRTEHVFVYGAGQHRLLAEKHSDAKMARKLSGKGLTQYPERIQVIQGQVQALDGTPGAKFRVWCERDAENPLPLRIEFQPKPFLALAFEAQKA